MSKGKQDSPTNEPSNPTHKLLPARVHDTLPGKLLLLPVRMRPFFPAQTMPIVLPEALWRETVERVGNTPQQLVGLILARPTGSEALTTADFRPMGTVVRMRSPSTPTVASPTRKSSDHIVAPGPSARRLSFYSPKSERVPDTKIPDEHNDRGRGRHTRSRRASASCSNQKERVSF